VLDLNLWEGDKVFIKWLEKYKFFTAKFNYKDGEMVDYELNVVCG
jgi:8-oxo-dGTP diphosphatase